MNKYIVPALVILLIIFLIGRVIYLGDKLQRAQETQAELRDDLKQKIVCEKDQITVITRGEDDKATQKVVYVPPSGKVEILTPKEDTDVKQSTWDKITTTTIKQDDGTLIVVKDRGFTFHPALIGFASKDMEAGLAAELVFWKRYGAGAFVGHRGTLGGYGSRTISDIIPPAKNTFVFVGYGYNFSQQDTRVVGGVGVFF